MERLPDVEGRGDLAANAAWAQPPRVEAAQEDSAREPEEGGQGRLAALAALPAGAAALAAGVLWGEGALALGLGAFVAAVAVVAGARAASSLGVGRTMALPAGDAEARALMRIFGADATPVALTDGGGRLLAHNPALRAAAGARGPRRGACMDGLLSVPDGEAEAPAEVYRLLRAARREGRARSGSLVLGAERRLTEVDRLRPDRLLWRLRPAVPPAPSGVSAALDALGVPAAARENGLLRPNRAARALDPAIEGKLASEGGSCPAELAGPSGTPLMATPVPGVDDVRLLLPRPAGRGAGGAAEMLERLPVAVARLSLDGRLTMVNAPARRLLGPGAAPGAALDALVEGLGRSLPERIAEAARGRATGRAEMARGKRRDRETFLQLSLTRVEFEGEPAIAAVMSDATELKTLEAQFVQSQKMQAVGQLAGGVAHDFNNLLTAISGHTDLLLMRHDAADEDHADLMQIRQNANRAAALVRQMLAFSRKQTLRPSVINLTGTLTELSHLLNRLLGEKVRLRLDHAPDLGPVRVDERQLEQVVVNLVVNARDAMPEGGEVCIRTRNAAFEEEYRRDRAVVPQGEYVAVEVSDTGAGIPPDRIGRVFEPFYTTKKPGEGTGLGLSTAYGIVKQTGGFIFVDSPPGEGTTFTIYLPRYLEEEGTRTAEDGAGEAVAPVPEARGVVLLVEDEAPVRSFAARALALRGYEVREAESAEEALEILQDPDFRLDVIVSDVVMPGMDGPSWVRAARAARPDVAVVFVSGYAEGVFRDSLQGLENFEFLPKPYSLKDLSQAISKAQSATRDADAEGR